MQRARIARMMKKRKKEMATQVLRKKQKV